MLRKEDFSIIELDYKTAMDIVVANHYLHRKAPTSIAFGLIRGNKGEHPDHIHGEIVGVVTYGVPASNAVRVGLFGAEEKGCVGELTRLWVDESVPKNGESFLIGNTIRKTPFDAIVSYADSSQGHIGYVYQATNWLYYGLTDKHVQWHVEGLDNKHSRHYFDKFGGVNGAKKALGDKLIKSYRPRKHRYLFLACDKRRKKELLKKFRYEFSQYPKQAIA